MIVASHVVDYETLCTYSNDELLLHPAIATEVGGWCDIDN
jgi:hypothetical protein